MNISRRSALKFLVVLPSITPWLMAKRVGAQIAKLKPTPQDVQGPYYPKSWDGEVDNDLTTFKGKSYPNGTRLLISGRVQSVNAQAIKDARVEIWQTDENANYRHPDSDGEGPAQRGFQGYGFATTDAEGRYTFRTIKPMMYGGRPAHVHYKVTALGHRSLITEMYFVGENGEGSLYQRLFGGFSKERDRLSVSPTVRRNGNVERLEAVFDLVLEPAA
jgi:protocatechuate 3,4-dioxygenase, beta subunit